MKKIIPLKKQLTFNTNVNEITSISLENTLNRNKNEVEGNLIISGTYKITEASINTDPFEFEIPVLIEIDEKYIPDGITIDINDFYYELINNNIIEVNIEVMLDNIIEKPMIEQVLEDSKEPVEKKEEEEPMPEINIEPTRENSLIKEDIKSELKPTEENKQMEQETRCIEPENMDIFNDITTTKDDYSTYYIYIVREGDTIETITTKYDITIEKLSEYNNINEIKLGDKIIIPSDARNK